MPILQNKTITKTEIFIQASDASFEINEIVPICSHIQYGHSDEVDF